MTAARGSDAHLDLSLDAPGVCRILAGTYEALGEGTAATGSLALTVACSAGCTRGQLDQKTFARLAQQQGGSAFADYAKSEIASMVHDDATAQQLGDQLQAMLDDPSLTGLDRFPTLPLDSPGGAPGARPDLVDPADGRRRRDRRAHPAPSARARRIARCPPGCRHALPACATASSEQTLSPCQFARRQARAGARPRRAAAGRGSRSTARRSRRRASCSRR